MFSLSGKNIPLEFNEKVFLMKAVLDGNIVEMLKKRPEPIQDSLDSQSNSSFSEPEASDNKKVNSTNFTSKNPIKTSSSNNDFEEIGKKLYRKNGIFS